MAAIAEAGGARCALCGVRRALRRVVLLGGLVLAGWLLGSGIGLASDDGSGGQFGLPPTVASPLTSVSAAVSVPLRSVSGPVKPGVLTPMVDTLDVVKPVKPLSQSLVSRPLVSRPLMSLSRSARGGVLRPWAPVDEPAVLIPATPATAVASVAAPEPTSRFSVRPATVRLTRDHGFAPAPLLARLALGENLLSRHPGTPIPASAPGSGTSVCMTGATASDAGTRTAPCAAVNDSWTSATPAPAHRMRYLSARELPRSAAARPCTAPD